MFWNLIIGIDIASAKLYVIKLKESVTWVENILEVIYVSVRILLYCFAPGASKNLSTKLQSCSDLREKEKIRCIL